MDLLEVAEGRRTSSLAALDPDSQAEQGQFFTPLLAARIIASLPELPDSGLLRLLDPGAGSGMLTAALAERVLRERPNLTVEVVAVEAATEVQGALAQTLADCDRLGVRTTLVDGNFIDWALSADDRFDLVIQNPPYAKLRAGSEEDRRLKAAGVAVPNMYAAFMALGARLLVSGGQQVAITPRSWMNGTYYSAFRERLLRENTVTAIHTFESRSKVFGDTGVLQETIVVCTRRSGVPAPVSLSVSHDHRGAVSTRLLPYIEVVTGDFVFVPATEEEGAAVTWMNRATATLASLGLKVSTGRVVDFRSRNLLVSEPAEPVVPMVYPSHFVDGVVKHPLAKVRKPQWFHAEPEVAAKMLVPAGTYVLIKRFSAREERRRVVAAVWAGKEAPAFDNKTNYIHCDGHGLEPALAEGLARWLNSTQVDAYFRVFSGHTQVNAGDLRQVPFPTKDELLALAGCEGDIDHAVADVVGAREWVAA